MAHKLDPCSRPRARGWGHLILPLGTFLAKHELPPGVVLQSDALLIVALIVCLLALPMGAVAG